MRCSEYSLRFSSGDLFEQCDQLLGVVAALDQPQRQQRGADTEQHADDPDEPRQALRERADERVPGVDDEREAVVTERDRKRRGLTRQRHLVQVRDQEILGALRRAQIERVVEVRERRRLLELRPAGERDALGVDDIAARQAGRRKRIPEAALRLRKQSDHTQVRTARGGTGEERLRPRGGSAQLGRRPHRRQRPGLVGAHPPERRRPERPGLARRVRSDELHEFRGVAVRRIRKGGGRRQRCLDSRERPLEVRTGFAHAEVEQPFLVARVRRCRDRDEDAGQDQPDEQHADRQPERPPTAAGGPRGCGLVFALCLPRRPSVGAGHRATIGHRDPGIITRKGIARASVAQRAHTP